MLRDIADATGMPPGQAHPYIVSFRKIGLVEQDSAGGLYRLGWFALHLGLARLRGFEPYQLAGEAIAELAQTLDLGVAITVWGTYGPTVIRSIESSHNVTTNSKPGTVLGLSATATGKVWAAFLPKQLTAKRIAEELKQARQRQAVRELDKELADIRQAGYAGTADNPWPGIAAACAPVFDLYRPDPAGGGAAGSVRQPGGRRRQPAGRGAAQFHPRPVEPAGISRLGGRQLRLSCYWTAPALLAVIAPAPGYAADCHKDGDMVTVSGVIHMRKADPDKTSPDKKPQHYGVMALDRPVCIKDDKAGRRPPIKRSPLWSSTASSRLCTKASISACTANWPHTAIPASRPKNCC